MRTKPAHVSHCCLSRVRARARISPPAQSIIPLAPAPPTPRIALKHTNTYHGDEPSRYAGRVLPALHQHTHVPSVNAQTQSSSSIIIIDHHRSLCASPLIARRVARTREPVIRGGTARGGVHLSRGARARGDGGGENAGVRKHRSTIGRVREWRPRAYCSPSNAHRTRARTRAASIESRDRISRDSIAARCG